MQADFKRKNMKEKKNKGIKKLIVDLPYNKKVAPYIFMIPFIVSLLAFNVYPFFSSLIMSFQKIRGFGSAAFVGFDNYKKLFNESFYASLKTTTLTTVFSCIVTVVVPLALALLLNDKQVKGRNGFRAIFFIPALASTIVAGIVFRMLFADTDTAAVNSVFIKLGIPAQHFMLNYSWSIMLMVLLKLWTSTGLYMIYFLSGLQNIPGEVYEQAEIDGANAPQRLFGITIPLLRPTIVYVLTMLIVEGYRIFGESYVFWKESTPGDIGLTIVRYLYQQAFTYGNLGFGSAIGFVLLAIVLLINLAQMKLLGLFKND